MNNDYNYSLELINKISEAKEISYYELKNIFSNYGNENGVNNGNFDLDVELEKLEEKGLVAQDEGMIIFEGL